LVTGIVFNSHRDNSFHIAAVAEWRQRAEAWVAQAANRTLAQYEATVEAKPQQGEIGAKDPFKTVNGM
jgi:hypothetical protein